MPDDTALPTITPHWCISTALAGSVSTAAPMPKLGGNTMHPTIEAQIMKTRTDGAHRRADQARLARTAKEGRRALRPDGTSRVLPRLRLRPLLRRLAI